MRKPKPIGFIVIYNDGDSLNLVHGADPDCEGALQWTEDAPLMFSTRKAAQRAIRISEAQARLLTAQGKPANDDYTTGRKFIQIVPVYAAPESEAANGK